MPGVAAKNVLKYLCKLQVQPCDAHYVHVLDGFTMRKRPTAQPEAKAKIQDTTKRKNTSLSEETDALEEGTARVRSGRHRCHMPATTPAT